MQVLPPIEKVKMNIIRVNEYDYKKMIDEFKFQDSFERIKRKKIKKVKDTNASYQQNVSLMKEKIKEAELNRMKKIKKNIAERNRILSINKQNKEIEKEAEMLKARSEREQMNKSAQTNASQYLAMMEEKRIEEEQRTEEKSILSLSLLFV